MRTALRDALLEIKEDDDGLYLIVGDIGFGVFEEFEEKHNKDYLNINSQSLRRQITQSLQ